MVQLPGQVLRCRDNRSWGLGIFSGQTVRQPRLGPWCYVAMDMVDFCANFQGARTWEG